MKFLRAMLVFVLIFCMLPFHANAAENTELQPAQAAVMAPDSAVMPMDVGDHNMSERENNNSTSLADRVYDDYTVSGYLDAYDIDYFKFTASAQSTVTVIAVADYSSFIIGLKNSGDSYLAIDNTGSYSNGYYSYTISYTVSAGTYYLCLIDGTVRTYANNYYTFYITIESSHTHSYTWYCDETCHWQYCECGSVINEEDHYGGTATATELAICEVCGQAYGSLLYTGWYEADDGSWFYFDEAGETVTGWQKIGGGLYYFDDSGIWQTYTGWQKLDGAWYYFNSSSVAQTGWQQIDGSWYYFDANGKMATGVADAGGKLYYFTSSGVWKTYKGWQKLDGAWYYFDSSSVVLTGWQKLSGIWYYFGTNGKMATGWTKVGTNWYFMDDNGVMKTGWMKSGNDWYYLRKDGVMVTGWILEGNNWFYMDSDGIMQTGWVKTGGNWYYMNEAGVMQNGWLKLGNNWYYLKGGAMVTNATLIMDGEVYTFNANGIWVP